MIASGFRSLLGGLLLWPAATLLHAEPTSADASPSTAPVVAEDLPADVERQIEEQTQGLPDEVREKIREQIREKLAALKQASESQSTDSEEKADGQSDSEDKPGEKKEEEKQAAPEKQEPQGDPLSEEAKKMRTEMELFDLQFKHRIAQYRKDLEERRLDLEKAKVDRELEQARQSETLNPLNDELNRLKLAIELAKKQHEMEQVKLERELAEARVKKMIIETKLSVDEADEKADDRVLGEERYPDQPFQEGVLTISDRRIELNGPIMDGAADYVCQRLDFFNNQSNKPIFIVIDNCPGGSTMEGFQIVQAINRSNAPVHVVVKRFAASMAAIITTLADHSYCYPDAVILHHQASGVMMGNGRMVEDQLRQLKTVSTRLLGKVAEKLGTTEKEFVDAMYANRATGDWDLFGDEAVKAKWVQHIAHTIREESIRSRPTGSRSSNFLTIIGGKAEQESIPEYAERYEVRLQEEIDDSGARFVRLPRLSPLDAWLIYNPDGYYRQ